MCRNVCCGYSHFDEKLYVCGDSEGPHTRHQRRLFNEYGQTTTGDHHCRKLVCRLVPQVGSSQNVNWLTSTKFTPFTRLLKWRRSCIDATRTSCRTVGDYQGGKGATEYSLLASAAHRDSQLAWPELSIAKNKTMSKSQSPKRAQRDLHHVILKATRNGTSSSSGKA